MDEQQLELEALAATIYIAYQENLQTDFRHLADWRRLTEQEHDFWRTIARRVIDWWSEYEPEGN